MGASVYLHWPNAAREDQEDHPGFDQDDHAYASWITAVSSNRELVIELEDRGLDALLKIGEFGQSEKKMKYATPDEIAIAAMKLKAILPTNDALVQKLTRLYRSGIGEEPEYIELGYDIANLASIAKYAEGRGAKQLAILIGW